MYGNIPKNNTYFEFPTANDIAEMPLDQPIKITHIEYWEADETYSIAKL